MNEKLTAGIVTAAAIAPVCALCILGPAVLGSMIAGIAGWFGGLSAITTAGLVLVAGIAGYEILRRRKARRSPMSLSGPMPLTEETSDERQKTP
jgi:hypothetical protein